MKVEVEVTPAQVSIMSNLGCGSHACHFNKPKGMGTNSGQCYCLGSLSDYKLQTLSRILGQAYKQAQEENPPSLAETD